MQTAKTLTTTPLPLTTPHLLRERQVLQHFPVSRSELWNRVRDGRFPAPVKLSPKVAAWRSVDVLRVLEEYGCVDGAA
ncbi:MAG: AlpA family phage regulatory protein [Solidesulfovibrio sp.]|uniref:helix-turn-helix transcriptional regulator n=1 Tax=Solidesulfovibrio sp. TaxID=2910990 RepID=UPI0031582E2F